MRSRAGRVLFAALFVIATLSPFSQAGAAPEDWTGTPPAEDCSGDTATAAQIVDALRTAKVPADEIPLIGIEENELPDGTGPTAEQIDAVSAVVWSATACVNAGDLGRFFGHLTPNATYALVMGLFEGLGRAPGPFTEDELTGLQSNLETGLAADPEAMLGDDQAFIDVIRDVRILDDGRILLLADGKLILDGTGYIVLIETADGWQIDRLGQIGDVDMAGISGGGEPPVDDGSDDPTASAEPEATATAEVIEPDVTATQDVIEPDATTATGGDDLPVVAKPELPESFPVDVIRSLAYHELTKWEVGPNTRNDEAPLLSDDGSTVVFARAPGSGDPANPNLVLAMNSDGSGEREIDSFVPLCYCGAYFDVSADGSRVVISENVQLRVAKTDGSGGRLLLTLASGEINALRISGDGNTIVFRVYRDTAFLESGEPMPTGVYAIDYSGENLRMLAGRDTIAAAFDVPVDLVPSVAASSGVDVSFDGQTVAAGVFVDPQSGGSGQAIVVIQGNGAPYAVSERVPFILNMALSPDGSTVGFVYTDEASDTNRVATVPAAGGTPRDLVNMSTPDPGKDALGLNSAERIQLSWDGATLLLGSTGVLIDTETGATLALTANDRSFFSGDPAPLVTDVLIVATMDAAARHVIYLALDSANVAQLARVDIEPDDLLGAPELSELTLDADTIGLNAVNTATVTVAVKTSAEFLRVGMRVLFDGRGDSSVTGGGALFDDGAGAGDLVAGDGTYTQAGIYANCCAPLGPRTMRVKAEIVDANGLRHASTIDGAAFTIVE